MFLFFTFYRTLLFYNSVYIFAVVFAFLFFLYVKWAPSVILANERSRNRNLVRIYVEQQYILRD